jgi:hypothetical protein
MSCFVKQDALSEFTEMLEMEGFSGSLEVFLWRPRKKIIDKKYCVNCIFYWIFDHRKPVLGSGCIKNPRPGFGFNYLSDSQHCLAYAPVPWLIYSAQNVDY